MNPERKRAGRTAIVHISDLHFDPDTDHASDPRWTSLVQDASDEEVDLLVVTGDLIDNAPALASERRTHESFENVKT
jgi:predicted MPP superfamily phosphohydrolase